MHVILASHNKYIYTRIVKVTLIGSESEHHSNTDYYNRMPFYESIIICIAL